MDKYKFGEFIYNQRKKLGITQDELGRKLGVTNKAVSKWETGETVPEMSLLEPLAAILNVTIDELLTQRKPEMILIRPKKWPHILWAIGCFILMLVIVILTIKLNKKPEKQELTFSNVNECVMITPCDKVEVDDLKLKLYGSIKEIKDIENPNLKVNLTIQYFYNNSNNKISEILYVDRYVTYDGTDEKFILELNPKSEVMNFVSFSSIIVTYEIEEVSGTLA